MYQEEITLIDVYAPNLETPKYIKQLLTVLMEETDKNTIIVAYVNIQLKLIDKSSKHKMNKKI